MVKYIGLTFFIVMRENDTSNCDIQNKFMREEMLPERTQVEGE
jgi:hypothetical protein